jgi:hypothetical protein
MSRTDFEDLFWELEGCGLAVALYHDPPEIVCHKGAVITPEPDGHGWRLTLGTVPLDFTAHTSTKMVYLLRRYNR